MTPDPEPIVSVDSPIRVPSIPDVVYESVRADIARGLYPAGPISIRQVAQRFGVSAMPVREALRRLQAEGLVTFAGARQVAVIDLSLDDLEEIFQIRAELESLALRLAVPLLADDQELLAKLDAAIAEMDDRTDDYAHWREANNAFHVTLYENARKPRLMAIITSQSVAVEPYARRYGRAGDSLKIAQGQHREILAAVRDRDEMRAGAVVREHLSVAFDVFRQAAREA
jgi:DNA-binding GntR family transcriptional regulator